MSGSDYYNHSNFPQANSAGASQSMRNELESIEEGFGKLPALGTSAAGKPVSMNADGSAMVAVDVFPDTTAGNVTTGAHGLVPKLSGNVATFLRGDGTWGAVSVSAIARITRTSNTMLTAANLANFIDITTGGFTQTFDVALPSSWFAYIGNSSTSPVTIPAADGMANWKMYPGEVRLFMWNGGSMFTSVIKPFNYIALASETFIWPPGYSEVEVDLVGGGGGGGSGRRGPSSTFRMGGACGGAPARVVRKCRGAPNDNVILTIGAAGVGGAAVTTDTTSGNPGTAGGNTSFGSYATAYGGAAGLGGTNSTTTLSTSGSGSAGPGSCGGNGEPGGQPIIGSYLGAPTSPNNIGEGGGGTSTDNPGGCTMYGGAGGDAATDSTGLGEGGSSMYGVPGATNGALITAANALQSKASNAGARRSYSAGGGGIGGTSGASPTQGNNGLAATSSDDVGTSGAGGGASITAAAGKGGDGGFPGGAGGGGGASVNGFASGAGGNGAAGRAVIKGIA